MIWLWLGCTTAVDSAVPHDSEPVSCDVANPDAPAPDIEGVPACGQPIFETYCGGCHGDDGRGREADTEYGPDLAERVPGLSHQELFQVLEQGGEEMPASGLSAARQAHVAAWLRATFD